MRAFAAFPAGEGLRTLLAPHLSHWRKSIPGCTWVRPANLHMTVKFLGEATREKLDTLTREIEEKICRMPPPVLEPEGGGCFPDPRRPRVLHVSWVVPRELVKIVEEVESAAVRNGFTHERRPFRAHITLARVRSRLERERVRQWMDELNAMNLPSFTCAELRFVRSTLLPSGARYDTISSITLGGPHD